jgi:hypothetical protein
LQIYLARQLRGDLLNRLESEGSEAARIDCGEESPGLAPGLFLGDDAIAGGTGPCFEPMANAAMKSQ